MPFESSLERADVFVPPWQPHRRGIVVDRDRHLLLGAEGEDVVHRCVIGRGYFADGETREVVVAEHHLTDTGPATGAVPHEFDPTARAIGGIEPADERRHRQPAVRFEFG